MVHSAESYSHLRESSTHKREAIDVTIPNMGKRIVEEFARTLDRLLRNGQRFPTLVELQQRSKVGKSTIARAKNGETAMRIDNLEDLAKAYGLSAWQLLVPGVDPKDPPRLRSDDDGLEGLTPEEAELLSIFRALKEPERTYLAENAKGYAKQTAAQSEPPIKRRTAG